MRRRIGAWRQPKNGKKKGMDELEAGWAAVIYGSKSQKFMGHKFLCCHHSEKEHEKGVGAVLCAYS